jgi:hypothetical protein
MPDVRLFFQRILFICLLVSVCIGLVFLAIPRDPTHYFAESLEQIRLLETTKGPRIILIGGSNVSFGIDAELMQKELHVPVINDGLHAGLGILPLLELLPYLHEGDSVIVSLEYAVFANSSGMEGDPAFVADWIETDASRVKYLSEPWLKAPRIYTIMLQRKVNRTIEYTLSIDSFRASRALYNSDNFDANGDFIGHLDTPSLKKKDIPLTAYPVTMIQDDILVFLSSFEQTARAKGVQIYFEAPASRQSNCDVTGETNMASFFDTLKQRLSIPILTHMDQVCMPDQYFFDTPYHLNAKGREIRTQRLIENLKQAWLASK